MRRFITHIFTVSILGIFLSVTVPYAPTEVAAAGGISGKLKCATGTDKDSEDFQYSIRNFVKFFNMGDPRYQGCKEEITLNHDIYLAESLTFKGISGSPDGESKPLVLDGQNNIIHAEKIASGCVITISQPTNNMTIKNLIILGAKNSPDEGKKQIADGICVDSDGNTLDHVRVGYMGGDGIVIYGKVNKVQNLSASVLNRRYGVYVKAVALAGELDLVKADTIVFGNNAASDSLTVAEVKAKEKKEKEAKDAETKDETAKDEATKDEATKDETAPSDDKSSGFGQQIYVENDQTQYAVQYTGSPTQSYTITATARMKENVATASETVLLVYRVNPTGLLSGEGAAIDLGNLTLEDSLIGFISANGKAPEGLDAALHKAKGAQYVPGSGFFKFNLKTTNNALIYFRATPLNGTVASSTTGILMADFKPNEWFYFYDNKLQTVAAPGLPGNGLLPPVLPDGTTPGQPGTGGPTAGALSAAYQNYIAVKQTECKTSHVVLGIGYPPGVDSDADGIQDGMEDNTKADCDSAVKNSSETNQFSYDTDGDGLPDGMEDKNRNGYVDCDGVKADGTKERILPRFRGQKEDASANLIACSFSVTFSGTNEIVQSDPLCDPQPFLIGAANDINSYIPDGSSLGANVKDASGKSVFWYGVPQYEETKYTSVICTETDPRNANTDDDGLYDGEELRHRYFNRTKPAYLEDVATGAKLSTEKCDDALLADGIAEQLGVLYSVQLDAYGNPQPVRCVSSDIKAWPDDFTFPANVDDFLKGLTGKTDPRNADTDKDGINDGSDQCPTNPDVSCTGQCFFGWRLNQIMQIAGVTSGVDSELIKIEVGKTRAKLQGFIGRGTIGGRDGLKALVNPLVNGGDADKDGIPDIVEAGLPELDSSGKQDCSVQTWKTDPFKRFTDAGILGLKYPDGVEQSDFYDPCPGVPDKTACKEPRDYALNTPVYACFVDRDNDQLTDCEEDLNLDKDQDLNVTKDTDGVEIHAFVGKDGVRRVIGETDALNNDMDDDKVPDGVELKRMGGTFYGFSDPFNKNTDGEGADDFLEIIRAGDGKAYSLTLQYEDSTAGKNSCESLGGVVGDTDPTSPDTDRDGIEDQKEIEVTFSNPTNYDSDNDTLCDGGVEVKDAEGNALCKVGEDKIADGKYPRFVQGQPAKLLEGDVGDSNPCDPDTDRDGKSDAEDLCKNIKDQSCKTPNAMGVDSDSDGIPDATEKDVASGVGVTGTDPAKKDTDGDGLVDGCLRDTASGELIMDSGELCNQVAQGQFFDNFAQKNSASCGGVPYTGCDTNPLVKDTDGDLMSDKQERTYPTNPIVKDTDGDGLSDGLEDTHFDISGTPIAGSIDGIFTGCSEQPTGKVCTETNANALDTDGDGLLDCDITGTGINGEDKNCNGFVDIDPTTGSAAEFNPRLYDTDGDGESDGSENCQNGQCGSQSNIARGTSGKPTGCSLATGTQAATGDKLLWMLLVVAPLLGLMRARVRDED